MQGSQKCIFYFYSVGVLDFAPRPTCLPNPEALALAPRYHDVAGDLG